VAASIPIHRDWRWLLNKSTEPGHPQAKLEAATRRGSPLCCVSRLAFRLARSDIHGSPCFSFCPSMFQSVFVSAQASFMPDINIFLTSQIQNCRRVKNRSKVDDFYSKVIHFSNFLLIFDNFCYFLIFPLNSFILCTYNYFSKMS